MFVSNVDLREYLTEEAQVTEKNTTYDLVANVVHDGKPTEGSYRIHVLHHVSAFKPSDQVWLMLKYCMSFFKCRGGGLSEICTLITGHREVVRAPRPAGNRYPASDDHTVRSVHTGQCHQKYIGNIASSSIDSETYFTVNVAAFQIWKRREMDDDGNSHTGA